MAAKTTEKKKIFLSTWVLYLITAYITPMMANLKVLLIVRHVSTLNDLYTRHTEGQALIAKTCISFQVTTDVLK